MGIEDIKILAGLLKDKISEGGYAYKLKELRDTYFRLTDGYKEFNEDRRAIDNYVGKC